MSQITISYLYNKIKGTLNTYSTEINNILTNAKKSIITNYDFGPYTFYMYSKNYYTIIKGSSFADLVALYSAMPTAYFPSYIPNPNPNINSSSIREIHARHSKMWIKDASGNNITWQNYQATKFFSIFQYELQNLFHNYGNTTMTFLQLANDPSKVGQFYQAPMEIFNNLNIEILDAFNYNNSSKPKEITSIKVVSVNKENIIIPYILNIKEITDTITKINELKNKINTLSLPDTPNQIFYNSLSSILSDFLKSFENTYNFNSYAQVKTMRQSIIKETANIFNMTFIPEDVYLYNTKLV